MSRVHDAFHNANPTNYNELTFSYSTLHGKAARNHLGRDHP